VNGLAASRNHPQEDDDNPQIPETGLEDASNRRRSAAAAHAGAIQEQRCPNTTAAKAAAPARAMILPLALAQFIAGYQGRQHVPWAVALPVMLV
jgi:hypothetical protein